MLINSLLFYVLKMASIKDKGEVFRVMLQGHETKQKRMFIKHENSVLDLISGR